MSWHAFLSGAARVLDLFGVYDPEPQSGGLEDDARALASDWRVVLKDVDVTPDRERSPR